MAQPIFCRLDSTIECYCSHTYVGKAYHLVTLSYPLLFVKKYCTGYDPRPIEPWVLAQTFLRTKTKPKLHSKSILFWMHDRRAHVGQCVCLKQPMSLAARYCLGEYCCRAIFWRQELVPMPLPLFPIEHIPCQE